LNQKIVLLKGPAVKRTLITLLIAVAPLLFLASAATDSHAGLGVGLHYLKTVEDMGETSGFDSSSLGFLGVFSFSPGFINFELDFEYIPNYAFDKDLLQPSAYAFLGNHIYGGFGVGIGHFNGEWADDPFFDIRAGLKILSFDFFGSYKIQDLDELNDLESEDLNAVTFGAIYKF
jgi:hypothetical protein